MYVPEGNSMRTGLRSLIGIINAQPFANLAGFDADGGIVAGIVAGRPAENFDADGALLEHVAMALERVFHHVTEEVLAALAGAEFVAGEDAAQFLADLFFGRRCGRFPRPAPGRRNLRRLSLRHGDHSESCFAGRFYPFAECRLIALKRKTFGGGNEPPATASQPFGTGLRTRRSADSDLSTMSKMLEETRQQPEALAKTLDEGALGCANCAATWRLPGRGW
jgi:hypothetical protein